LKLRFMCQDMPRMQDFAPFTLERPLAVRTTSQALDNLNFDLDCPNDY
jgi:hypothetical protein